MKSSYRWTVSEGEVTSGTKMSQQLRMFLIRTSRSLLITATETMELSQMSAISEMCQVSHLSTNDVLGTTGTRPRARHTLLTRYQRCESKSDVGAILTPGRAQTARATSFLFV